ncbi:hypothetical protein WEI85_10910 [Actinomycetes bacterium KLBMP 9797]
MKPHRTDGVSLTFALIFLTLFAWWLLSRIVHLSLPVVGWFVAGGLIFLGVLGLVGALRSGRGEPPAEPAPAPPPEPAIVPISGVPAELHADIVRELLEGPRLPEAVDPPIDTATDKPADRPAGEPADRPERRDDPPPMLGR